MTRPIKRPALARGVIGKRVLDVVLVGIAFIVLAPVFLVLALAIRIDSPGPAIFKQQRVGRNGKIFVCLKFRTMVQGSSDQTHRRAIQRLWAGERISDDPKAEFKLTNDARVTSVGRWLRRTSLDELPQLINVLRGEMSIVGPRPAIPYEIDYFQEWHHERHSVKPGITGLWQVRGRGRVGPMEMLRLDVEYVRTWTLWTDLKLIVLTIPAMLRALGAR
ncbi:MAG: sugar transferase [Mesorhizobium sp.]|nr:MAG: sugar transferase [Mesorhizobium sp.]